MKRSLSDLEKLRAQELLVQRATEGLDAADEAELARLGADDVLAFDLAAAALDVATVDYEPMPADVAQRLSARGPGASAQPPSVSPSTAPAVPAVAAVLPDRAPAAPRAIRPPAASTMPVAPRWRPSRIVAFGGWGVAAAAAVVATVVWVNAPDGAGPPRQVDVAPAEGRAELLATVPDHTTHAWSTAAPGVTGDVVWSPRRSHGYMRFVGLAVNEPTTLRYQVWIVDRARDARYPVDGGVFDASSTGEIIVPIEPRIPVADAVQFIVTAEASGGAVVSDRARIVAATAAP